MLKNRAARHNTSPASLFSAVLPQWHHNDYRQEPYSNLATARQKFKGAHKKTIRLSKFSSHFISSKIESLL